MNSVSAVAVETLPTRLLGEEAGATLEIDIGDGNGKGTGPVAGAKLPLVLGGINTVSISYMMFHLAR